MSDTKQRNGAGEPPVYTLRRGKSPLMVSIPHAGTHVPKALADRMTPEALALADTDWHLPEVYDFAEALDATILAATHSRLVIDLNRPPDDASLYPGQDVTGLVPIDTFRKEPVYRGALPDAREVDARRERYWQPYHDAIAAELHRLRESHPRVVLWESHSIASELPRFFEGRLPDLNFGTSEGRTCALELIDAVLAPVKAQRHYEWVLDGRFKGGHITREYADPAHGVHTIQLEMTHRIYMDERPPFTLRPDLVDRLRPLLRDCLKAARDWAG